MQHLSTLLPMTRKGFLRGLVAGCIAGTFSRRDHAMEGLSSAGASLLIPYPAKPWTQATRIVGARPQVPLAGLRGQAPGFDRTPLFNDFCMTQSGDGRWHCIGILFEGHSPGDFRQNRLFHFVSDAVDGPYQSVGYVDLGYGKEDGVWAPCIVRDGHRTLMYYAHAQKGGMSIRFAQAEDARLEKWHRSTGHDEIAMSEQGRRDPQIIKDGRTGKWLMYYVCSVKSGNDQQAVVRVRASPDLMKWSEPQTVLGSPPGYGSAESVFVLQEKGHYYMWVSNSGDYGVMSLYVSNDPFDFGDAAANRIEEQRGHAAEIVRADGRYWIACVAIASIPGLDTAQHHDLPIAQHDLEGVWIQPLEWRTATDAMKAKVFKG